MTTTTSPPRPPVPPVDVPRRRGRAAKAWVIGGAIVTVILLVSTAVQFVSWVARDELTVTRTFTAAELSAVRVVEIRNSAGRVDVTGTADDDVEVDADISRGLLPTRHRQQIEGDRLVITGSCPEFGDHCRLDYRLTMPAGLDLTIVAVHGHTRVSDVDGAVTLDAVHGDADLTRLAGPLDLQVGFGELRASQLSADTIGLRVHQGRGQVSFDEPPRRLTIDSQFADVDISFPDVDVTFAVTLDTSFGSSENGLRTDPASSSTIDVRNRFGQVTLAYAP